MAFLPISSLFIALVAAHAVVPTLAVDTNTGGSKAVVNESSVVCADTNDSCQYWASTGECQKNPGYMMQFCQKSCGNCGVDYCPTWKKQGLCANRPAHMYEHCGSSSCNFTSYIEGNARRAFGWNQDISGVWWLDHSDIEEVKDDTMRYIREEVWVQPKYTSVRNACTNRNDLCTYWALKGRCNESNIKLDCGPSCFACDFLDENVRCGQITEASDNALHPGDVNTLFKRITSPGSEYERYNVTIHSQPLKAFMSNKTYIYGPQNHAPWILTFDNFLMDKEVDRLLSFGEKTGYQESRETFHGNDQESKTTQSRTSFNSWCGFQFGDQCFNDPVVKDMLARISKLTRVPVTNFNEIQILRYHQGQYYKTHGDYIVEDEGKRTGARILTFFLYLSDVEEGGETEFPYLDPPVRIKPKKGRAALWANVLDNDPAHAEDPKTWHQALPVLKGTKYAANSWIYMRDFRTPTERKCSM